MIDSFASAHEQTVVTEYWRQCAPVRLRSFGHWAESELRLPSGPSEGRRYRLDRLPYARLLFDELGKWRRHCITGPTQSGKTLHAFVFVILYYLFEMHEDVIVGVPDLGMGAVKWDKDIRPVILRSAYRDQIPRRGPGSKGGTPTLITFRNGRTLQFMAGGGGDKQRAGATAKVLLITETDGLDQIATTSREGQDKISQLEARIRAHGMDARLFMECTVSTHNARTWQEYQQGTRSVIQCQCPVCSAWVAPEREHFVGWDNAETRLEAGERAAFSCPDCGVLYSEQQRRDMNLGAKLVHRGQELTPDGELIGEPPQTDTLGFRWSAFHNLLAPSSLIGMEEWTAQHADNPMAADIVLKQQVWCLPAEDTTTERVPLTIGIVRGSAAGYHGRCNGRAEWSAPEWCEAMTAHVDVGMRVLNWSVNAHGADKRRDVIAYGATPTEQPDVIGPEEAILSGLHRVREIIERNCDIDLALVDCGYQGNRRHQKNPRRVVYEFVISSGDQWAAAMGLSRWIRKDETDAIQPSLTGAPWYYSRQEYLEQQLWVVDFDPSAFKHLSHGGYLIQPHDDQNNRVAGSVTIWGDDAKAHNEFATQLNNERFEVDHKTGRSEWKRHGPNHYFDTDVGNLVAKSVLDSIRLPATVERPTQPPVAIQSPDGRAFFVGDR